MFIQHKSIKLEVNLRLPLNQYSIMQLAPVVLSPELSQEDNLCKVLNFFHFQKTNQIILKQWNCL